MPMPNANAPLTRERPTAPGAGRGAALAAAARRLLIAASHVYFAALLAWLLAYWLLPDANLWLFAVNALAVYLFLPLPLIAAVALAARRRDLWVLLALGALLWAGFFGPLFVPRSRPVSASGPTLRVMAYNLLGYNRDSQAVVAAIRASAPDIVSLQELNHANAQAIERELAGEYPYQLLRPEEGVHGAGVISRFPFAEAPEALGGPWLSAPIVLTVDVDGRAVTYVRFHAFSGLLRLAEREAAARELAAFAARHPGPLIAAGDLNATRLNRPYATITRELHDAWAAAGWGLGHTFPGGATPGNSRPTLLGVPAPSWLVRIDYVFYSNEFTVLSARIGQWDGASDHRPVVVDLALAK